jgi:hypothetical protein
MKKRIQQVLVKTDVHDSKEIMTNNKSINNSISKELKSNVSQKNNENLKKKERISNREKFRNHRIEKSAEFSSNGDPYDVDVQLLIKDEDGNISSSSLNPILKPFPKIETYDELPREKHSSFEVENSQEITVVPNNIVNETIDFDRLKKTTNNYQQDINRKFCDVLENGTIEDILFVMADTGPKPDVIFYFTVYYSVYFFIAQMLSVSTRNRLYDVIATVLSQDELRDSDVERCLIWVLALLRGKNRLIYQIVNHTKSDLQESLKKVKLARFSIYSFYVTK